MCLSGTMPVEFGVWCIGGRLTTGPAVPRPRSNADMNAWDPGTA